MTVSFVGPPSMKAEDCIYHFDQAIARHGIKYFAKYHGRKGNFRYFSFTVSEQHRDIVDEAIMAVSSKKAKR